jgi:hypothetical protein
MDPNLQATLFYTLSTVAQTLAGAMGLLGAIVLFALQGTAKSIEQAVKRMIRSPHGPSNQVALRHLYRRHSFHELAKLYATHFDRGTTNAEINLELMEQYATFSWFLDHDRLLRQSFLRSLITTGVVVSVSLIGIAFVPQLELHARVVQGLLVVVTVGAIVCLVQYGLLLRLMLATAPEKR